VQNATNADQDELARLERGGTRRPLAIGGRCALRSIPHLLRRRLQSKRRRQVQCLQTGPKIRLAGAHSVAGLVHPPRWSSDYGDWARRRFSSYPICWTIPRYGPVPHKREMVTKHKLTHTYVGRVSDGFRLRQGDGTMTNGLPQAGSPDSRCKTIDSPNARRCCLHFALVTGGTLQGDFR
jgi:hypothetical protein